MAATAGAIRAGRAFVELFADQSKLVRGLRQAAAQVRAWTQSVAKAGRGVLVAGLFDGLEKRLSAVRRQMEATGKWASRAGWSAMIGGAMTAAPGVLAAKTFAGFEDQMLAVKGVTQSTGEEFDRLYQKAKLLGRTTSFTAGQVGAGMLNLARAGFSPAEIDSMIGGMLNLARATGTDLAQASDIAAAAVRSFNLQASDMNHVADVLVATANNSAQTMEDLGESLKYVAPTAADAGMTLEETSKALGALANMGIKGTMAGTALNQMIIHLAAPKTQQLLTGLGVSARGADQEFRPLADIMMDLGKALGKLPGPDRIAVLQELFDVRGARAGAKLTVAEFDRLNEAIDNAAGVAQRTADTMDSGLGGAFRIALSAVEGLGIALGEALATPLKNVGQAIQDASDKIGKFIKRNQTAVVFVMEVVAAVTVGGAALWTFGKAFLIASAAMKAFTAAAIFFAANPLLLTATVAAVAILAIGTAFSEAKVAASEYSEKARDALSAGDQRRTAAIGQIKALQQLAEKERLTSAEQAKAKLLIDNLQTAYGDLGLSINSVTGKVSGLTEAQAKLNKMLREQTIEQVSADLAETQANIASVQARMLKSAPSILEAWLGADNEPELNALSQQADALIERAAHQRKRLRALKAGSDEALTETGGNKPATSGPSTLEEADQAIKAEVDARHKINDLVIQGIEDRYQREKLLIGERYRYEVEKAKAANESIRAIEMARDLELANFEKEHQKDLAEARLKKIEDAAAAEEQLRQDVARAEIEASALTPENKRRALLDLEHRQERARALLEGLDMQMVGRKQQLEKLALNADIASQEKAQVGAVGTFNPFAVRGMVAGGAQERTARATEKAAGHLEKIEKNTKKVPVFG